MELSLEDVAQILGQKELELIVLRNELAECRNKLSQYESAVNPEESK